MTTERSKLEVLLELRDKMSQGMKKATSTIERHQKQFRKASLLMAGAAGVLGAGLFAAAQAGRKQELAVDELAQALENVGVKYADVQSEVLSTTAAIQKKTNFGDEEQIAALALLIGITGDYESALLALQPTLDLAAAQKMDLKAASSLVSRAVSGETGALTRYGVKVEQGSSATEVFAAITAKFGGQAEAAADPVIQLTNALGDMAEGLGIREIVKGVASALFDLATVIQDHLPPPVLKAVGIALAGIFVVLTAGAVVTGILAIAGPIVAVAGAIAAVGTAIAGFAVVAGGAAIAFAPILGVIALVVAALVGLGVGIYLLVTHWDTVWGAISDTAKRVWGFISGLLDSHWGWLLPGGLIYKGLTFLRDNWTVIWEKVKAVFTGVVNWIWAQWGSLAKIIGTDGVIVRSIGSLWDYWKGMWEGMRDIVSGIWDSIAGTIKAGVNVVIGGMNLLIRALNKIKLPAVSVLGQELFGGLGFDIPEIPTLDKGAIVTKPTLALLAGNRKPEGVFPLSGAGAGAGGVAVTVNMPSQGLVILSDPSQARRLATALVPLIRQALRSQRGF